MGVRRGRQDTIPGARRRTSMCADAPSNTHRRCRQNGAECLMATLVLDVAVEREAFSLVVEHDITLDAITAVYGPSASGKTTLLRVIAGLEERARGRVEFDGAVWQRDDRRLPAHARGVGYVFQDGRLFGHLTVEGNLRFAIRHAARRATPKSPVELSAVVREL